MDTIPTRYDRFMSDSPIYYDSMNFFLQSTGLFSPERRNAFFHDQRCEERERQYEISWNQARNLNGKEIKEQRVR